MTPDEVRAFLGRQRTAIVGSLDPDGSPHPDAAACALLGESLYFVVAPASRTQRNLQRDARACCACEQFPTYYEIKAVALHGTARAVAGDEAVRAREALADVADPVTHAPLRDGVLYALGLDDAVSFDFGKIERRTVAADIGSG